MSRPRPQGFCKNLDMHIRQADIRFTKTDKGHKVINAVDESGDHLFSWHSNGYKYDYYREGKLLYLRP